MSHADKLRAILEDLHQELAVAPADDPEVRRLLIGTVVEVSRKLSRHSGPPMLADDVEPLRIAAREFEAEHPKLAQTLESLVDALARMGI